LVGQPTRIGHMWRIVVGHITLLIYNKHLVDENN